MRQDTQQEKMFFTRATTDEDVLLVFATKEEYLTRWQIAERLWRKKTPGLISRIERLVNEGRLVKAEDTLANGRVVFWYKKA